MIKSMTAFAQETTNAKDQSLTLVVRTYNSRYLDINLRLAGPLSPLEDRIKELHHLPHFPGPGGSFHPILRIGQKSKRNHVHQYPAGPHLLG